MPHGDLGLLGRIMLGFALAYAFGFERHLRGSPAGDRTFVVVGAAATRSYGGRFQKDRVPDSEPESA